MEARFEAKVRRFGRALQLDVFEYIAFLDEYACYVAPSAVPADPEW